MLDTIARKILPIKARQVLGCWTLNLASHSILLLRPYLYLLHGYKIENLTLNRKEATYIYNQRPIVAPRDGIGSFFEVFQEEVYDKILKPEAGDIVIDIGAYVGMWTVKAVNLVGSKGRVIAIEPSLGNLCYLKQNMEGLPVEIVPLIVSDRNGQETFYISKASACHSTVYAHRTQRLQQCKTLDTIVKEKKLPRVDFIKVDAEGAEMKVLQGAGETLKGSVKLSIASYHTSPEGKPEAPKIIEFLEARGFHVQTDSGLRRYIYAQKMV